MKPGSTLLLMLIMFGASTTGNLQAQQPGRTVACLDDHWKFSSGNAADPAKDFNYLTGFQFAKTGRGGNTPVNPTFADSSWTSVNLPHDWAVGLPFVKSPDSNVMSHGYKAIGGFFPENSIGWYRRSFSVARADSGKYFSITFDGVFRNASFWLNGFYLGTNESGYSGVTFPISDYINFRKDNVLVVRVDASQFEGWFYEGAGIYRHVWLNSTNPVRFAENGVFVYSDITASGATVSVAATVEASGMAPSKIQMKTVLTERSGRVVAQQSGAGFSHRITVPKPRLWSPEDPYLYRATAILLINGKETDRVTVRFGIRSILFDGAKGLIVNGRQVKIKGTNNHQDHAGVGSALPDYLQYWRINQLKNFGVNAYRTSHNPPTPELLDACDSLGMLVLDETRLVNTSPEYMSQLDRLILRDRNHPSVILWSIGNEEGVQTTSVGKRMALTMMQRVKELDPTRTCTYAADVGTEFNGINEVIPVRGFNYRHTFMKEYHAAHPGQPVVGTEMGSTVTTRGILKKDTVACYLPDQDLNAPWWASLAEAWWPQAAENDWIAGGFIWTGFDYRGEPTPFRWPNVNSHFGILDVCGFPKSIAWYYKSWWSEEDVLNIWPHWNNPAEPGVPVEVWVNSNADSVELLLNGKSLGTKIMVRNSHLNWQVPYEPGKLAARGWRAGRLMRTTVETTAKPAEIVLMVAKTTLFADNRDATVINIRAIDREGRWVPDAQNLVKFSVEGDARIIGTGNGDPSSHESDQCAPGQWQRHLFNGYCQVILQAGTKAGIVKFKAEAEGCWSGESEIHTVAPYPVLYNEIAPFTQESVSVAGEQKMVGADISFLPQLEAKGMKFYDRGLQKDPIEILRDHGFNYIRLRIFNNPAGEKGYAPGEGWCDLKNTLAMAKRTKALGMKLLLDFHYSDTWADPQKQFKPAAWESLSFDGLKSALKEYTRSVIAALAAQGTTPDMVQIGNEINHGMVWPEGHTGNPGQLASLVQAGIEGVKAVDPGVKIMLHVALGGQWDETALWVDQMMARGCRFDVLGLSFYPKWHGTLDDLKNNIRKLIHRYPQPICIVEYSAMKEEVNDLAFSQFRNRVMGSCIWEPLNTWDQVFEADGKSNDKLLIYDQYKQLPEGK